MVKNKHGDRDGEIKVWFRASGAYTYTYPASAVWFARIKGEKEKVSDAGCRDRRAKINDKPIFKAVDSFPVTSAASRHLTRPGLVFVAQVVSPTVNALLLLPI